ncbi:mreC [Wigglesworthia glossinidia endosymbiont of Glossina brevipalpis]|uniref:Cell shape-determining protein MreC n=1 Tax=Wigglesworthia glossinidia brevipalpis TaxID=36870 RepID=Q8D1V6_WIGBR|nr:mreC [Wigglesworthia glossinidia endosymbiont of Glossina brevipalpis]
MKNLFRKINILRIKFFFSIFISFIIIYFDLYSNRFSKIRCILDTIISPIYFLINAQYESYDNFLNIFLNKTNLYETNKKLNKKILEISSEQLLFNQYKEENIRLRNLLRAPLRKEEKKIFARVIFRNIDFYTNQIIIDKGTNEGIYIGQSVIDNKGIIGQVIASNKFTSRVLLVCDFAHAIPLQSLRSDIRFIAFGNGCDNDLKIEYLKDNLDIKVGDVLVTSGLGGTFPEGYPVATISSVDIKENNPYPVIYAHPTSDFRKLRYILLLCNDNYDIQSLPSNPESVRRVGKDRLMQIKQEIN